MILRAETPQAARWRISRGISLSKAEQRAVEASSATCILQRVGSREEWMEWFPCGSYAVPMLL